MVGMPEPEVKPNVIRSVRTALRMMSIEHRACCKGVVVHLIGLAPAGDVRGQVRCTKCGVVAEVIHRQSKPY